MINMRNKKRGFTLIEILVTATIIAVLTAIGLVSFRSANIKARDGKRMADIEQLKAALEIYRSDNPTYPSRPDVRSHWANWVNLMADLSGYITSSTFEDPKNVAPYFYQYTTGDSGVTYSICYTPESDGVQKCFDSP